MTVLKITKSIIREHELKFTTECKLIGWALINPELPECQDLVKIVNVKNLSPFGRIVFDEIKNVIAKYPDSAHYGRMQQIAFRVAIRQKGIPRAYIYKCMEAAECWVPHGPNQFEIKELTA